MPDDSMNNGSDQILNDPSSFLFASLADFYREHGLFQEAVAMCEAGLEAQQDNLDGRLVLARCHLSTGNQQRAREEVVRILSRQSEHREAKRLLAEIDQAGGVVSAALPPAPQPPEA
ncbi:MAG: tetratricopeptide repeat protein, partial [Candidatus Edwardsbacteria bacterium]|nr:tetratricopeptide repeat protein [Candidatus Edwardsbacteria bacterium]